MTATGPYLLLAAATVLFSLWLGYAAFEAFHYELMARTRLLLVILGLIAVLAMVAFYFFYVLETSATGGNAVEGGP